MKLINLKLTVLLLIGLMFADAARAQNQKQLAASVYQYAVPVGSKKAYLWIPPQCRQVRGLIVSFSNLLELNWMESPIIRTAATRDGLGVLLIELSTDGITPELKLEGRQAFLKMLKQLANESGYKEIEYAPFIPIDHSIHGVFTWNLAAWLPQRTIAAVPVKSFPFPADAVIAGIPMCYLIGENDEWPPVKDGKPWNRDFVWRQIQHSATTLRAINENNLIGVATDPGGGHLDWSDKLSQLMALFIHKACLYRLPKRSPLDDYPQLTRLNPQVGWLTDTAGLNTDQFKPAPYLEYQGNPKAAYWFFDKEMATAVMNFAGNRHPHKKQMVSFMQSETLVILKKQPFISLQFKPDTDGITFYAQSGFFRAIPADFIGAGTALGRASGDVQLRVITGPAVQLGPDKFQVAFNRSSPGGDIWLQATQPGDAEYNKAVQPAQMKLPARLTEGAAQTISFSEVEDQNVGTKSITLKATSSAGLPVRYFVVNGPAIALGDSLIFTPIPVKSKYPVKVTVKAYQWGRINSSQVQSAEMVTQSFNLIK